MLPLLIGGAATLIGGMMQQGAVKRQERERAERIALQDADILEARKIPQITTVKGNLKALVADAEAAGFNPLTVLRSGGAGMYSETRHPNLFPIRGIDTAATGQSPMGSAIQGVGSMVASYDYGASARNSLEQELLRSQITNVNTDTQQRRTLASTVRAPAPNPGGYSRSPNNPGLGLPAYDRWTEEVGTVTNPFGADWWHSNPWWSDIETGAEARFGDVGGAVMAPVTFGADLGFNLARGFEALTGQNPRQIGQWIKQGISQFAQENPAPLRIHIQGADNYAN